MDARQARRRLKWHNHLMELFPLVTLPVAAPKMLLVPLNEWRKIYIWRIKTSTPNGACSQRQVHTVHTLTQCDDDDDVDDIINDDDDGDIILSHSTILLKLLLF